MVSEKQRELSKKVKVLRAERGWTQEELAKRSGVSICLVYFVENCKKKPRVDSLMKIAKAFGIDADELLKYVC